MSKARLCLIFATAAILSIACRGAAKASDSVPASLPGSYVYAARGSTLKKPWQFAARLDLRPDKSYTFTLDKTVDGKKDPTETNNGSYSVSGDHIIIDISGGGSKDIHKLLIKADSLIAEVGWTGELILKGVGAPNVVFVKERRG